MLLNDRKTLKDKVTRMLQQADEKDFKAQRSIYLEKVTKLRP